MNREATWLTRTVLCGFGQLFLCHRAASGALFLMGLAVASLPTASWSLLAASLATLAARLAGAREEAASGLFGVNGALLGMSWGLFPELEPWRKLMLTLLGTSAIVLVLVPTLRFLQARRSGLTPFAMPYLLAVWGNIALATHLGWYDADLLRGWSLLAAGQPRAATQVFEHASPATTRARAYRADGWGWSAYLDGRYAEALAHFHQAQSLLPELHDASTGGGWAAYRLGDRAEARRCFEDAVKGDPSQALAWDGLGWLAWEAGDPRAAGAFRQCLIRLPLLADAHAGQSRTLASVDRLASDWHARVAALAGQRIALGWQLVAARQWIAWGLFLLGVGWHSRISLAVGALALAVYSGLYLLAGPSRSALTSPWLVYNLLPLALALGGLYLRLTVRSVLWLIAMAGLLIVTWPVIHGGMLAVGLPALSLPFHLLLIGSLVVLRCFPATRDLLVPLETASSSPEEVRLWDAKRSLARDAWAMFEETRTFHPTSS